MPNAKIIHDRRESVVDSARQHTITPTRMYTAEVTQSRIGCSTPCPPTPKIALVPVTATLAISSAVTACSERRPPGRSVDERGSNEVRMAGVSAEASYWISPFF